MALQRKRGTGDESRRLVSPIYAALGPRFDQAFRVCDGDGRKAELMMRDWRAWRAEYGDRWDEGDRLAPPPPHEPLFGYARPA